MRRELSAGGVLVRRMRERWWLAAIRPRGRPAGTWALPKGLLDAGETGPQTAIRETCEETGVEARLVGKLGDVRYIYTWEGERVFKIVSFFLLHPVRGRLGALPDGMEREVADVRWLPLGEAVHVLAYSGERDMAARALEVLARSPL